MAATFDWNQKRRMEGEMYLVIIDIVAKILYNVYIKKINPKCTQLLFCTVILIRQ